MNLSTLLISLCSRVPGEDLTDKQILSIKSDLGSARHAAQNMALGVAAVGNLLANVGAEGEVGQETSERLGWFLEEIGGGIFQLVELEQVLLGRINRQKEAQQ
ncbi:hypothetical protein ABL975_08910 [Pseudomonas aeruginosa]|uniref:hypothetical protein n=1 Tax=Pseudomonas aeruginosa TaxID=287 RepID=UPI0005AB359F|nr:hypothetical protein [Pseudomonas aeruginosa]QMX79764.1 hypothetical protein H5J27_23695 [Pseudomonas aeruginosa]RPP82779.1 hypothetical protein IPC1152_01150 [Pseudomonas aeruginosa]UEG14356.1 hypothetical protein LKM46_09715 [Pseudomonas aeruginosa]UJC34185.1 hypothetical protein HUK78_05850 [Pseudomonas aeruginosa]WCV78732.1 hypothetical protein KKY53_29380 [Pseudomonas aeruginosa]